MKNGRKRIGLALGGGVARGFAHVGALAVLEEAGIPLDYIAGVSAGSIIGAIYSAGLALPHIVAIARQIRWSHLARPVLSRDGFVSFVGLEKLLVRVLGDLHFEDLAIPFATVATDMETGESVTLNTGRLAPAVCASCSVPGLVTPVRLNGRFLGDGGVTNNLPVSVAHEMGADYVIGVDISSPTYKRPFLGSLGRGLAAIEIMIEHAGGGPAAADCLITPKLAGKTYLRLDAFEEFVALGRQAAEAQLPHILDAVH